jgi:hypothetical protein
MPSLTVQTDGLREASRSFRQYSESHGPGTFLLLALLGASLLAVFLYAFAQGARRTPGRRTFLRLAKASRLDREEQAFLLELARRASPEEPGAIFLRRSLFEAAVADLPVKDPVRAASVRGKIYAP